MNKRNDFPMIKNNLIYLDNAATTFKPKIVIDSLNDYYLNYCVNANRASYALSTKVEDLFSYSRSKVKEYINADADKEIIFTSGTTKSLNMIVFGYFSKYLNKDDEVLITKTEHASLIVPWKILSKKIGFAIKFIDLDINNKVTIENVKKSITKNTKVISISHITNTIGDTRPLKKICDLCNKLNILTVIDAAQSIGHTKIDVQDIGLSFLAFSSHKMYGPMGTGILYGKYNLLDKLTPTIYGGGSNISFDSEVVLKKLPSRLESGTQNIPSIISLSNAIDYIENIGLDNINVYEKDLREYAVSKLKSIKDIIIYNENVSTNIILFNIKNIFAEDLAIYLSKYNICIRAGDHCAKLLKDIINIKNTCRISLSFYNTKEDIDKLYEVLSSPNILKDSLF